VANCQFQAKICYTLPYNWESNYFQNWLSFHCGAGDKALSGRGADVCSSPFRAHPTTSSPSSNMLTCQKRVLQMCHVP